jgi:hypothetical protein
MARKENHMTNTRKSIIFWVALLVMINGVFYTVLADHDGYKEKRRYQKTFEWDDDDDHDDDHERGKKRRRYQKRSRNDSEHYAKEYLPPVNNQTYLDECGACHLAYQPGLLPSGSWNKILAELEDHFGETVDLDKESKKTITGYLKTNSAEHSGAKRSVKIMRNLGNNTPMRITDLPCIQAKHRKISQDVLRRESIGSLSNCSACHVSAEKGIYEDDYVRIPQ